MTAPTPGVAWDSTGKWILATTFNDGTFTPAGGDPDDLSGVTAFQAAAFDGSAGSLTGNIRSHTLNFDNGSGPVPYTFTVVFTYAGAFAIAGDQVQAILDLLANPPSAPAE